MKRIFVVLVLAFFATSSLTSCSKTNSKVVESPRFNLEQLTIEQRIARFKHIDFQDLMKDLQAKSAVIVDANSPKTFANGHIPTAINYFNNQKNLASVLPKEKAARIICYCGSPRCISWLQAAEAIEALGYTNIYHFEGGLKGWLGAGAKLVK